MSGAEIGLALSVFLACAVEAVEALTIVLAVGTTRSWSSALCGVGAAAVALAAIVLALGPALTSLPIEVLRVLVGGVLLIFGLQWLRKAILRAAGLKAETRRARDLRRGDRGGPAARAGCATASTATRSRSPSKACCLRGWRSRSSCSRSGPTSITSRSPPPRPGRRCCSSPPPASRRERRSRQVPENAMKFAVGVMLSSFGMFWGAEGAGAHWPAATPHFWRSSRCCWSPRWAWRARARLGAVRPRAGRAVGGRRRRGESA